MFCWFSATSGPFPEWDQEAFSQPLPVSTDRRTLKISHNMWSGPIRFEVLVDVNEAESVADFGPHERYEADFRGDTCSYALQDLNHWVTALDGLAPGDYRAILLVSGIDPHQFDSVCEESNERYRLLLQPVAASKYPASSFERPGPGVGVPSRTMRSGET